MKVSVVKIQWPNGNCSKAKPGSDWIKTALEAGVVIPTGCLGGSCGACEIEVNGKVLRACINTIPLTNAGNLKVEIASDPAW